MEARNYGFNLELEKAHQEDTDWMFGAASTLCRALIPMEKRVKYLPTGEVQYEADDFQDCATRGPINILQLKFNYLVGEGLLTEAETKWLTDNKYFKDGKVVFSKRFNAMLSGTTRNGNSLKAPVDSIHRDGLIPERMLMQASNMTWDQYHDKTKITPEMIALGKQFLKYFPINYERVYTDDYPTLIGQDEISVAGHAWNFPENGVYLKTQGTFNHVFLYFLVPTYTIFDNYVDSYDGDFIKQLAPDYLLMEYGYRLYIGTKLEDLPQPLTSQKLLTLLKQLLKEGRWQLVLDICKSLGRAFGFGR